MSTVTTTPNNTVALKDSNRLGRLKAETWRLGMWRKEFAVIRDRRIYADFFSASYQQNNLGRLQHLESLGLDLANKSVLELGAGVGDHSLFYLYRNCRLIAVEGRPKLAKKLSERLGIDVRVIDLDREPEKIESCGESEYVHCYGLLYHLSNPARFLSAVSRVGACLLLETCVSFGNEARLNRCREAIAVPSQALHGEGCRPTREWIFSQLKLHYEYVYATRTQPRHPEFPIDWSNSEADGTLKRAVFVASHTPMTNSNLLTALPMKQIRW